MSVRGGAAPCILCLCIVYLTPQSVCQAPASPASHPLQTPPPPVHSAPDPSPSPGPGPEVCDDDEDSLLDDGEGDLASPPSPPPNTTKTVSPPTPPVEQTNSSTNTNPSSTNSNSNHSTSSTLQTQLVQKVAFPTTIASHPSTIQYIPITPRATATLQLTPHDETQTSTPPRIQYQLITNDKQNTIHYQIPTSIIVSNAQTHKTDKLLHFISQPTIRILSRDVTTSTKQTAVTSQSPALADQHIRVLTPSEIMSTLPTSLGQESFEPSGVSHPLSLSIGMKALLVYFHFFFVYSE